MILASAVLGALVVATSSSASTLLSGYGGPGAGEQAIIGSTLLNAPGSGSGGRRAGAALPAGGVTVGPLSGEGSPKTSSLAGSSTTSPSSGGATPAGANSPSDRSRAPTGSGAQAPGAAGIRNGGKTGAFVYPIALRSTAAGSSALSLNGADLGKLAALIVVLLGIGALTVRMARLRR